MTAIMDIMDISDPIFKTWVFWSTVLILKMLGMAALTAKERIHHKVFSNDEDAKTHGKDLKSKFGNDDVERVRRAHLNDMENIPAFITVSFFFLLTQPSAFLAINLIRVAAIGRILHTVAYVFLQKQPHRAIAWFMCFGVSTFMGVRVLMAFI